MSRTTIETYTGLYFDFTKPDPQNVCIEDIARALSMTARFGGHTTSFYSVAEHSLWVRQLVIEAGRPDLGLSALLHDAHEAYVGDIPTPLKALLGESFLDLVDDIDLAICDHLIQRVDGIQLDLHAPEIVKADAMCLRHEAAVFKKSCGTGQHWGFDHPARRDGFINGWSPDTAESVFLGVYHEETKS